MKYRDCMYGWNPAGFKHAGKIKIGPHPDKLRWSENYSYTMGACILDTKKLKGFELMARILVDFHTIVVRDGIAPQDAHREFLKIDEYRKFISRDIKGAV